MYQNRILLDRDVASIDKFLQGAHNRFARVGTAAFKHTDLAAATEQTYGDKDSLGSQTQLDIVYHDIAEPGICAGVTLFYRC